MSIPVIGVGWLTWMCLVVAVLVETRRGGFPSRSRLLLLSVPAVLSQLVCLWTLLVVLHDQSGAQLLLVGSAIASLVFAVVVYRLFRMFP